MLEAAGWHVQNYAGHNTTAALGVAVREYPLKANQSADYLLFINGTAVGVIEAKPEGTTLSGALQQAERYRASLPDGLRRLPQFPFSYASTGVETCFRDIRDPDSRSRKVFTFHTPDSLLGQGNELTTLRENIRNNLSTLEKGNLWDCQFEAIINLEESLKEARPRALIQMATGSGKTYAAVSAVYRLIRFSGIKRVLFLVDRRNLGRQALREFQSYTPPDDNSKFTELYNVQHLASNTIDPVSQVCITTLQRLYSMLKGETDYETEVEEASAFENEEEQTPEVTYNPSIPIDTFDVITAFFQSALYANSRDMTPELSETLLLLSTGHLFGLYNPADALGVSKAKLYRDLKDVSLYQWKSLLVGITSSIAIEAIRESESSASTRSRRCITISG